MRWTGPRAGSPARAPGRHRRGLFFADTRPQLSRSRMVSGITSLVLVASGTTGVYVVVQAVSSPAATAAEGNCAPSAGFTACQRLTYTGADQSFTVPAGVNQVAITSWGAGGGGAGGAYSPPGSGGGGGASSTATVAVTPGQVLGVVVGQGGRSGTQGSVSPTYGGGGAGGQETGNVNGDSIGDGSSGGGLSAVFSTVRKSAATALLVAGGGGGSSPSATAANTYATGGGDAVSPNSNASPSTSGRGGASTVGGAGATSNADCTTPAATSGAQFQGGNGSGVNTSTGVALGAYEGGGGGGGGWFGGGGGKCQGTTNAQAAGSLANGTGAGGSSYLGGVGVTGASATAGGNGSVTGAAGTAADTTNAQYVSGVGAGGRTNDSGGGNGGNGLVVIQWARTYSITASATPASVLPGDTVTYSVAVTNTSPNAILATDPATFADNLSGVLDDAVYNADAASNVAGWTFSGLNPLTGAGPLAAGQTATITFSVTVKKPDTGNSSLVNSASANGTGGSCTAGGCAVTTAVNQALDCAPGSIYATTPGQLLSVDTATGAGTVLADWPDSIRQANALAITAGGTAAYVIDQSRGGAAGDRPTISRWSAATKTITTFTGSPYVNSMASGPVRGGINLSNGIYYYGATRSSNTVDDFYAFDTRTNTSIGYVGSLRGFTGSNGDLTFDSAGNMLLVVSNGDGSNNRLIRVSNVPTTASTAPLTGTTLTSLPPNVAENGITFDGDGYLYASTASLLYKLNPNTGALISSKSFSGKNGDVVDLADCEVNGSLSLQTNIVARADPGDQFTLTVTGGGVSSGNTGTTSGSSTGVQSAPSAVAGPVIGILGTTYTLTETAASGSLADYTTSISCVDRANGNAPVTATAVAGSTTSYTLVFPSPASADDSLADVVCTMTNTAFPRLAFSKTLAGNRVHPGDQFTLAVRTGSPSGPSRASTTTTGSGSTVAAGTAGPILGTVGTTYYLTEAPAGSTLATDYTNRAITCTDANGNQTGLPTGAAFTGSVAITPVAGANISCVLVNTANRGGLSLVKSATPTSVTASGQSIAYSFLVTNTGNVTVDNLSITDAFIAPSTGTVPAVTCPVSSLAAGASTTCTATYRTTQDDIDNGAIDNSAFATGTDPSRRTITSPVSTATVSATRAATLTIRKTASPTTLTTLGQRVAYSFLVTNTGNSTVTTIRVNDTFSAPAGPVPAITCPLTTLTPGASTTCTAGYSSSAADFDAGSIRNSATVSGRDPAGNTVTSAPSTATVTLTPAPRLSLIKSADPSSVSRVGQRIAYSFLVTNAGNVSVSGIAVADTFTAPAGPALSVSCPVSRLAAGASTTCTATYTVTQADLDNGTITNSATVSGTSPTGTTVTSPSSTATVNTAQNGVLTIVKSADPSTVTAIGQSVAYSFLVTNAGNVNLSGITVVDTLTAPAGPALAVTCPVTALAPGASTTCTAGYVSTAADFNAGSIKNSATVSGRTPGNVTITSPASAVVVTTTQTPGLSIVKSATPTSVTAAGQTIAYSFRLTNTGDVSLTGVAVTDTLTAPAAPVPAVTCPRTTLTAAGTGANATMTCTATYTVTQADIDSGSIRNSATASGVPPTSAPVVSAPSAVTVTAPGAGAITVAKSASPTTVSTIGQPVSYSFLVRNTGTVTLNNIAVTDTFTAPGGPVPTITCPATTLAPNASTTCTATYSATAADFDAGSIRNSATVSGRTPANTLVTSAPSTATVTTRSAPAISVVKAASPTSVTTPGQIVAYTFLVTNTGTVTLTDIAVADTFTAPAGPALTITCPAVTLAATDTMTCTASYAVTQADLDNGTIINSATATGTPPTGPPVTSTASTAVVTAAAAGALRIVKSAAPTRIATIGAPVTYSFVVTNTGNVTLTGVTIVDTFTAPAGPSPVINCPSSTLAPGVSLTCTASYTSTAADFNAGSIRNAATVSGRTPGNVTVTSAPSTATVTIARIPRLSIVKSASPTTVGSVGQNVVYSFLVTNTGNVTVTGLAVNDSFAAPAAPALAVNCPTTSLAAGASTTCTGTYAVTQADLDAGTIGNSATAGGTAPGGAPVTSPVSTATVTTTATGDLTIQKSASPTTITTVGQAVEYSFAVRNTGSVTLSDVAVTDTFTAPGGPVPTITCPSTTLAPGGATTCTASYPSTAADFDAGSIRNTATASARTPADVAVTSAPSSAVVTATSAPGLSLVKSASPTSISAAGQSIGYSFLVTNTGNVTLTGIAVSDAFTAPAGPPPTITCPVTTLGAGASTTCRAAYSATQVDINHGSIANSATAAGTPPTGARVTSAPSTALVAVTQATGISVVKTATPTTVTAIGESVSYSFVVTNRGNVTLSTIAVADTLAAPAGPSPGVDCPATTLTPSETMTCTASYTATAADFDAGSIRNSATASGRTPGNATVTSTPSTATVTTTQRAGLTIVKSASPATVTAAGQSVDYSFLVTNTGTTSVTGIAVTDTFTAPAGPVPAVNCPRTTLTAAGTGASASTTCTAAYTVTQADIDNAVITNTATASGKDPNNATVTSGPSTATVTAAPSTGLTIVKSATPSTITAVGRTVRYSFLVTNTGQVTLSHIAVDDTFTAPAGPALTVLCPTTTLAPGGATTCTASYTSTAADFNRGAIVNSATASARDPRNDVFTSAPSTATVIATQTGRLTLVKSADPTTVTRAGDSVRYSFVVTNSGNVALAGIVVTDAFAAPAGPLPALTCPTTALAAGASMSCTASYTATQADIDSGAIVNSAFATGTPPVGTPVRSATSTATVTATTTEALTLVKSASPTRLTAAGQTVRYSFLVGNDGDTTIGNLAINDSLAAPAGPALDVTCPLTTLAPGARTTCTATYTATQADADAGAILNSATASGTDAENNTVLSAPSQVTVTVSPAAALTVVKSAQPVTVAIAGTPIDYSFRVTNSGNVTLTGVAVGDVFTAPAGPANAVSCPQTRLAVGASTTCTASYRATQADIDSGAIVNTATASGSPPSGPAVTSSPSSATVSVVRHASLTVVKSATPTTVTAAGQSVAYSFRVTNTGTSTVANLAIDDSFTAPAGPDLTVACPVTTLAPAATTTCTGTYTVSIADMDNASIVNTATAVGTDPDNAPIQSAPSTVTVTASAAPALTILKTALPATVARAGDTVVYSFRVANTGNVTLSRIAVTDVLTAPAAPQPTVSCPATTLAPGAATTCSATYSVTQADVDNATIVDTATATGTPPSGPALTSAPSSATVIVDSSAALTVLKTASPGTVTAAGQSVDYSFLVTNDGTTSIGDLHIADTFTAPAGPALGITCPTPTLAPLASTTCTGAYIVTQADMDHGSIVNTATADGVDPRNNPVVSPPSVSTVTAAANIVLTLVKSASPSTVARAGDKIAYSFLLTNTGNVSLTNLSVIDRFTAPAGPPLSFVCPTIILGPGGSTVCSGTYSVSQADIDNGTVLNSAVALAQGLGGSTTHSNASAAVVGVVPAPALSVVKSADPTSVTAVGQRVTYSFVATNTGNETLTGFTVDDTLTGPAGPTPAVTCPTTPLPPGAHLTCTAVYTVTAADVDAGSIQDTATATGLDPGGNPIVSAPSAVSVSAVPNPALTLVKSADPTRIAAAGDFVAYSFLVSNTGNVTLTGVGITDNFGSPAGPVPSVTCPVTRLAAGASTTCTANYTASQADVDNGTIINSATASGTPPSGPVVTSAPSVAAVDTNPTPALTLVKSARPTTVTAAGATVTYAFLVTNTGSATVTGLSILDTFAAPAGPPLHVFCPVTSLAPLASTTCTSTYLVTQADVDAGTIGNSAVAEAEDLRGDPVASPPSQTTVDATPAPALSVVKTANPSTVSTAGDQVGYSFDVTNTGNVTLTGIAVTDVLAAPAGPAVPVTCPVTTLAPGLDTICRATYTATAADIANGDIANSALATGRAPSGPVTSRPSTAVVTVATAPALTIVKSVTPTTIGAVGASLHYSFLVSNRGNATLTDVAVSDSLAAPAGPQIVPVCPITTLPAGASTTCTADYTATAADVDSGRISNSAVASGTPPAGPVVTSAASTAVVTIPAAPALRIVKHADPTTITAIGDQVDYTFLVTNSGNVTLTDVAVADALAAPAGPTPAVICPATTLAEGDSMTCTASYLATAADFDQGRITNSARVTGTPPRGGPVNSAPASASVIAVQNAALTVVKSADPSTITAIGDTVSYSFRVTNSGNVTLSGVSVADRFTAPAGPGLSVSCPQTTLAAGAATTCTATYVSTRANFDAGTVVNSAIATADPPSGPPVTSPVSTATVTTTGAAALTIDKRADTTRVAAIGDPVDYSFQVTNTGNVTLGAITVHDTFTAPAGPALTVVCPTSTLAAGAATTCTAVYTATAADFAAGQIVNTATASGQAPDGSTLSAPADAVTVTTAQFPAISLVKSALPATIATAGDQIQYTFLVTNSGNVPLRGVRVTDTLAPPAGPQFVPDCPATTLAAGASMTCTATYTSTSADFDAGFVNNSAIAAGTPPQGSPVTSPAAHVIVQAARLPALNLVKSATVLDRNRHGRVGVGDAILWTFSLVNTGNVSLSTITVDDPKAGAVTCAASVLAPDASTTCSAAPYTITQADVDAGTVQNSATASGLPACAVGSPACRAVESNHSIATTGLSPATALALTKTGQALDSNRDGPIDTGDSVRWTLTVTNAGTTTVRGISVIDPSAGTATCPAGVLLPGASMGCTVPDHVITAADAAAGEVSNIAQAVGNGFGGPVRSQPASATVTLGPSLAFTGGPGSGNGSGGGGSGGGGSGGGAGGNGGDGGALAFTGAAHVVQSARLGAALILLGLVLLVAGLRRRRT